MRRRWWLKAERARFVREATAFLREEGAVDNESEMYPLRLPTIVGPLLLKVVGDEWPVVFGRFEDVEAALEILDINRYSGKWNHHYDSGVTVDQAVADFKRQISRLAPMGVA